MSRRRSYSICLASSGLYGTCRPTDICDWRNGTKLCNSQIRQGIANNTKGTAFVVYEDVMDAKQACDKLNGFNFQNRYLVGMFWSPTTRLVQEKDGANAWLTVLYHQPEKMARSKEDLAERQENLEKLKRQHGIEWDDYPSECILIEVLLALYPLHLHCSAL